MKWINLAYNRVQNLALQNTILSINGREFLDK
jgi:hypothetical protein